MRVERKQQNVLSDLTTAIVMVDSLDASVVGEEKVVVDPIDRRDQARLAGPHRCEEGLSVPACGANRSMRETASSDAQSHEVKLCVSLLKGPLPTCTKLS